MNDKIPEITEEFTMTVTRADGITESDSYAKDQRVFGVITNVTDQFFVKLNVLAKEILNERRRTD